MPPIHAASCAEAGGVEKSANGTTKTAEMRQKGVRFIINPLKVGINFVQPNEKFFPAVVFLSRSGSPKHSE